MAENTFASKLPPKNGLSSQEKKTGHHKSFPKTRNCAGRKLHDFLPSTRSWRRWTSCFEASEQWTKQHATHNVLFFACFLTLFLFCLCYYVLCHLFLFVSEKWENSLFDSDPSNFKAAGNPWMLWGRTKGSLTSNGRPIGFLFSGRWDFLGM